MVGLKAIDESEAPNQENADDDEQESLSRQVK